MKRIDWYVLTELAGPFFFGVAAFGSIMIGTNLLFKIARYIVDWNMPVNLAGKILLLQLPGIIVLTFPMSTLLATLLAFGRMSSSSEIIAFKAGGVSFIRLVIPVLIVGILVSFLTIYINEKIVPFTNFETRRLEWEFRYKTRLPSVQRYLSFTPIDYKTGMPDYILYAKSFDGDTGTLSDVYFQDFENKRIVSIIEARKARWLERQWVFFDGKTYYFPNDDQPVIKAEFKELEMKKIDRSPKKIALSSKKSEEMTAAELKELINIYQKDGRNVNKLLVEYYQRFAIPFSCFIFALIGAPLGLQPNRSGSSIGLGLSIIVIFIYYVVLTMGGALGQAGTISPILGAWLPNVIFALVGICLIYKASR
ncbi:permease [Anoxybacter fermentans]|uniref:Permease n=1 Tax=Anoxybacter fermentans TaxID=1323375 RepID=A0A3S9T058_9FIRM|nr:LptF/LptG family permease [Anoxybacter fermentans]AZR73941.1 permease [Anoxybacter fermentans]